MPIKIPKGFQRRKSSGNVLDEAQGTEPSFKVFARPQSGHKSLDINLAGKKSTSGRKNSFEQEDDDLFTVLRPGVANRGATENSLSTAPYDSGASSIRLSSSSTNPSSVDTRSDRPVHVAPQVPPHNDHPAVSTHHPKSSAFLRNAGRTFSFGVKSKAPESFEPAVPAVPATKSRFSLSQNRERAMTASSVTTTTAPRLLESDLTLDNSGMDGFGNMFDGIGAKSREPSPIRLLATQESGSTTGHQTYSSNVRANGSLQSQPIGVDRSTHVESSPYSWTSENSRDALMHTPNSVDTVVHNSPQLTSGRAFGKPLNHASALHQAEPNTEENMFDETPSRARAYSRTSRTNVPPPSSFPTPKRQTTSAHSSTTIPTSSLQTSPILEREDTVFDPSLSASAALASRYQDAKPLPVPSTPSNKKVMTPAQFERYRQQQDERHRMNKVFQNRKADSDDSDDNYDDAEEDDEVERDRQAARQRRKQEAHLAVYRQTMMKVTGEVPAPNTASNIGYGNHTNASHSATDLANQFSAINFDKSPARSTEDDEDDDVPLGILAAHGFPNKNKPPNRLTSSSSIPNLRGAAQPPQPVAGSVAGESMKRGSLPVFARHLPEDPYYGAGLVNPANRESIAMHSTNNYVHSGASTAHPHHPAGLVGVIAGEERARAMRRGSPSGNFELPSSMQGPPGMPRSQTTGSMPNLMVPGMAPMAGMPGMPPMPGMLSPGDHAQIQMSQQMTQMMQMQMQWMQQMQSFMANQGATPGAPQLNQMGPMPPMPPNMLTGANMPRPQSVPLQNHAGSDQRTMSLLSPPTMGPWNGSTPSFHARPPSHYAPSIAPSERSNVGLASRYRPVSTVQEPEPSWNRRASTMTSLTSRPWSQVGGGSKQPPSTIRKVATAADDEDDEQGWAEMKAKKEQKKKIWKLRKGQNVLQELYNGTT